jgi:hypothetical protein
MEPFKNINANLTPLYSSEMDNLYFQALNYHAILM